MADLEGITLDGRPLQFLRMANLKAALKERGLSKSGPKNELVERLKGALMLENLQRTSTAHTGLQPNSQIGEKMSQNSFIKQYLAEQQELLRQRLEGEAREAFETNDQRDNAEVNNSTLCPPQVQDVTPALLEQHKPPGPSGEEGLFGAGNEVEGNRNEEADTSVPPASGSVSMHVSGGDHQPERGSKSSKAAADSDYKDSEDGEEADNDDCNSSAQRRSLREPVRVPATRERSGVSCQPKQQHIPSLLSPQLWQPTPPSSPPPELPFPLPDTPKQSPPSPDVDPGRRSPSTCSSGSYRSCSRSSSPEPQRSRQAERKPGPLTLLAHKMERELALEQERELALEQERLGCSQARLGRGSPLCEQLREQIVQQFKNNISQRTIARNLGIPPSTVHRIIKRFRESGEISARKGQGRKPTLNAHDLRSFRRHCIKNQHHSVKDRTIWAQEHFGKPLSVNTVRRYIYKCKLMQSDSQISTKPRNATGFSGPELI